MKKVLVKIVIILLVVLLSLIAFVGAFKKDKGVWNNLVKDYTYGMDIRGSRELAFTIDTTSEDKYVYVDDEGNIKGEVWKDGSATTAEAEATSAEEASEDVNAEEEAAEAEKAEEEIPYSKETKTIKANNDEDLTKENFEKTEKIIKKRLNSQDLGEYTIRMDDVTGKLFIENLDDEEQVSVINQMVEYKGDFKIVDYQNGLTLMDNSYINKVTAIPYNDGNSYTVYLQVEFNEEGKEKLREISNKYVETKKESAENTEESEEESEDAEEESEIKYISVVVDDTTLLSTYFAEEMKNGILQITMGKETTDYDEFLKNYDDAKIVADTLDKGTLPIKYSLETDNFVHSSITNDVWQKVIIGAVIVLAIISLVYIVKFKLNGVLAAILNVGYIALLTLLCRYANVEITINSLVTGFIMIIIDYVFVYKYMKQLNEEKGSYEALISRFGFVMIPFIVIAVIFTLMSVSVINSIGMMVFWGIVLNVLYNYIFTKNVIEK